MKMLILILLSWPLAVSAQIANPAVAGQWTTRAPIATGSGFSMFRRLLFDAGNNTVIVSNLCIYGTVRLEAKTNPLRVNVDARVIDILDNGSANVSDPETGFTCNIDFTAGRHRYVVNATSLRYYATEASSNRFLDFIKR